MFFVLQALLVVTDRFMWIYYVYSLIGSCLCAFPISFFNRSLTYDILTRFDSIYCILNVLFFMLLETIIEIKFHKKSVAAVLIFICIPFSIVFSSLFFYDALPEEIFTLQFRKIMFGANTLVFFYYSLHYSNAFETHIISIFDIYEFDLGRFRYSCCATINAFCCKMFVLAFISPESHVQHSISLRKIH
jgi:hypothetical protein